MWRKTDANNAKIFISSAGIWSHFSVLPCVSQHAATVFLHHPCAPLHERMLLSILARSCLTHYILTSHPQLKQHTVRQTLPLLLTSGLAEATLAKVLLTFQVAISFYLLMLQKRPLDSLEAGFALINVGKQKKDRCFGLKGDFRA